MSGRDLTQGDLTRCFVKLTEISSTWRAQNNEAIDRFSGQAVLTGNYSSTCYQSDPGGLILPRIGKLFWEGQIILQHLLKNLRW